MKKTTISIFDKPRTIDPNIKFNKENIKCYKEDLQKNILKMKPNLKKIGEEIKEIINCRMKVSNKKCNVGNVFVMKEGNAPLTRSVDIDNITDPKDKGIISGVFSESESTSRTFKVPFNSSSPITFNFSTPGFPIYDVATGIADLIDFVPKIEYGCDYLRFGGDIIFPGVPCDLPEEEWCEQRICIDLPEWGKACAWGICVHYPTGGTYKVCENVPYICNIKQKTTGQIALVKSDVQAKVLYEVEQLSIDCDSTINFSGEMTIVVSTDIPISDFLEYLNGFDTESFTSFGENNGSNTSNDILSNILSSGKDINWFIDFSNFIYNIIGSSIKISITSLIVKVEYSVKTFSIKYGNRNLLNIDNMSIDEEMDLLGDGRSIEINADGGGISAEFILGTFALGDFANISSSYNKTSKNFLRLLIKMLEKQIRKEQAFNAAIQAAKTKRPRNRFKRGKFNRNQSPPVSVQRINELVTMTSMLNAIIDVSQYSALDLGSFISGIDNEVTLSLKLDTSGFKICSEVVVDAGLVKNIVENVITDFIAGNFSNFIKLSGIALNALPTELIPQSIKNEIQQINDMIDDFNNLILSKIAESLLEAIDFIDDFIGLDTNVKICAPLVGTVDVDF